ncbi:T9SS type A sorting domain-containing protein [candidate division WOR-3 bacterium]|nr:T9SS type A sorting domain-containing protein [candidate division WOR-3 bacterium]
MKSKVIVSALLLAVTASVITAQYAELKIVEIKRPSDEEEPGVGFLPTCVVNNNSTYTETAKVSCKIKDLDTYDVVYEDALSSFPCKPGNTTAKFAEFVPEGGKEYNAFFKVESAYSGDTKEKNFTVTTHYNVTPIRFIGPDTLKYPPFCPSAEYAELAGLETQAFLFCVIVQIAEEPIMVYCDSLMRDFAPEETCQVVFTEVRPGVLELQYGHRFLFWAEDYSGNFISKDTLKIYAGYNAEENVFQDQLYLRQPGLINNSAEIYFSIPCRSYVNISVYDAAGNLVTTLAEGAYSAGSHSITWARGSAPGVYFVKLKVPGFNAIRKVVIVD